MKTSAPQDCSEKRSQHDKLFSFIAHRYPTEKISTNKVLAAIWRILFYSIRPSEPFIMRLPLYQVRIYPRKRTLMDALVRRGRWEPAETRFFMQQLKPGSFVIDAGANYGHYALTASRIVGSEGLVVGFEPSPSTYELFASNIALLPTQNVVAEQAGLAAESGFMDLVTDVDNPGGHSFNPHLLRQQGEKTRVPVFSVDDYLAQKNIRRRVDVLKIDTEGFEWQLIKGARGTILRDRPVVFCEVTPEALKNIGDSHEVLLDFFKQNGYSLRWINRQQETVSDISYDEIKAMFAAGARRFEVLVFMPGKTP